MKLRKRCAEGEGCKLRKLEALSAKWDTDDGDAPNESGEDKSDPEPEAAEDKPEHVCDGVLSKVAVYGSAKGPDGKLRKLEALLTEGNTDNGDAPDESEEEPADTCTKAGEEEPKNVTDSFH